MSSQRDEEATADNVLSDADSRMAKAVEFLSRDVSTLRTGRATTSLVEGVMVDYYGTPTPLNQLATITVPEARLIVVQPYDRQAMQSIEKGLQRSDTGLNPSSDGTVIRLAVPPLTQERRREIVRVLKRKVEDSKVAVRNVRRDALERLRSMEKDKSLSQDDNRRAQDRLQKATDAHIGELGQGVLRQRGGDHAGLKVDQTAHPPIGAGTRDDLNVPLHVAIVMDGNGRWAEQRGLPRLMGHRVGVDNIRPVLGTLARKGVKYVSLYAFSTENWNRPTHRGRGPHGDPEGLGGTGDKSPARTGRAYSAPWPFGPAFL